LPTAVPMPAVTPIASAPQNPARSAGLKIFAPPSHAPSASPLPHQPPNRRRPAHGRTHCKTSAPLDSRRRSLDTKASRPATQRTRHRSWLPRDSHDHMTGRPSRRKLTPNNGNATAPHAAAMVFIQLIEQRTSAAVRAPPRSNMMPLLVALPYPRSQRLHGDTVPHVLRSAKGSA